jgi:hypothetical protein
MRRTVLAVAAALCAVFPPPAGAQFGPPPRPEPPRPPRAAAPVDFTGDWVAVVTEDWRWRMLTPLKGDAASVPTTPAARKIIDAWDPARDEAAGLQCKAYGAPAIMRVPGRLRIRWLDDETLQIETDAGQQTRVLRFGAQPPADMAPSWQGYSSARWGPAAAAPAFALFGGEVRGQSRTLEVTTTHLREGYLRKNGVPYGDQTVLREFFDRFDEPNGDQWFMVTTVVEDPVYLAVPFVTTSHFKKIPDGEGWSPEPCTTR